MCIVKNSTKQRIVFLTLILCIVLGICIFFVVREAGSRKNFGARSFDTQSIQNEALTLAKDYYGVEVSNPQVIHQKDRIFVMFNLDGTGLPAAVPSEIQTGESENFGFIELKGKAGSYQMAQIARSNYDSGMNRKNISISGAGEVHYGIIIDDRIAKIEFYCGNFLEETFVRKDKEHFYLACLEGSQGANIYWAKLYDKGGTLLYTQNVIE